MLVVLVDAVLGIIETILGLRLILRLFGANASVSFVDWIYRTSTPLLAPFNGIFPTPSLTDRFVLEFTTIFAIVVYAILAYFIVELIQFSNKVTHRSTPPAPSN